MRANQIFFSSKQLLARAKKYEKINQCETKNFQVEKNVTLFYIYLFLFFNDLVIKSLPCPRLAPIHRFCSRIVVS